MYCAALVCAGEGGEERAEKDGGMGAGKEGAGWLEGDACCGVDDGWELSGAQM